MNDTETHLARSQQLLWFVCVGAVLTGAWLAPLSTASAISQPGVLVSMGSVAIWTCLIAGFTGWSLLSSTETVRLRVRRGLVAAALSAVTLVVVGLPVALIAVAGCPEGEGRDISRPVDLLIAAVYLTIGYFGFARSRRLLYLWPLAVIAAILVYLALALIGEPVSGCSG